MEATSEFPLWYHCGILQDPSQALGQGTVMAILSLKVGDSFLQDGLSPLCSQTFP